MNRLTSTILFLGGAVLLATWLVPPAGSSPATPRADAADGPPDQVLPALTVVNAQVDRLRGRLSVETSFPAPQRDPFNFGSRLESPTRARVLPPVAVEDPIPVLPNLVAILTDAVGGDVARTAVLSDGDAVEFVKMGGNIESLRGTGGLRVTSISTDAVVLTEPVSNRSFGLSLH